MALGNLASRVLVAVIALPLLLAAIYADTPHIVWAVVFVASMVALHEFMAMAKADRVDRWMAVIIGAAACAGWYWLPARYSPALMALIAAVVPVWLYFLFRFGDVAGVADRMNTTVAGIFYCGVFLTFVALIKRDALHGADLIVLLLATAWASDTGAYFAGKGFGRHKLYPAVSPNKTVEGAVGGVAAAVLAGVAIKLTLLPEISWLSVVLLSGPGAILGQLGDLVESLIKRSRGVKDSGTLLPGHGGILDRIDAVLFIAPYFYLYLLLVGL